METLLKDTILKFNAFRRRVLQKYL